MHDPMGLSTCVTCGECVQACPTGALYEKSLMDKAGKTRVIQEVDKVVGHALPVLRCRAARPASSVKDNRIVQVDGRNGFANENRLCVKGRFGFDYAMSPERLTKPLIRRDDAPKAGEIDLRGVDPLTIFREATWEEALERAAAVLSKILKEKGGPALAGFGSAKGSNEEAYLFQKLVRTGFETNNVDHCTRLCHASSVAALLEGVGSGAVSAPFTDALKADCVIVIGARPTTNHPVAATYFKAGGQARHQADRDRSARPGPDAPRDLLAALFKPGSDVAMLNALIHTIIDEKMYDEQYIQANVTGFEALKAKVKDFSPEAMAPVCGIDAETLRGVARTYAKSERSMIFWGLGISQHTHGTDNSRCLIALALITGHVGRPGTGLHPLRGQNNVQGASDVGLIPMFFPDYKSVENIDIRGQYENFWGQTLDPKRGLTVVEIVDAIHAGQIKGMYIMGENPRRCRTPTSITREQHSPCSTISWCRTSFSPRRPGTPTSSCRPRPMPRRSAPIRTLTARCRWAGRRSTCRARHGRTGSSSSTSPTAWTSAGPTSMSRMSYAEMMQVMPSLKHITWERVEREGSVIYPADGPDVPGNEIIFKTGFPTADGRGRIVPADLLPARRSARRGISAGADDGPDARALAYRGDDAACRCARRIEPQGIAAMKPLRDTAARIVDRRHDPGRDAARQRSGRFAGRPRGRRRDGVHAVLLQRESCQRAHQPDARSVRQDPEFKYCAARVAPAAPQVRAAE